MTGDNVVVVGGDPLSHLVGFTRGNSFSLGNLFSSIDLGRNWTPATSFSQSSFYDFSTSQNPIAPPTISNIGTYSVGAVASGLASSDPRLTPSMPSSVLLTHDQLTVTACGPNLPVGR